MSILVTGCAGFIGYHVTKKLLEKGYTVIGIDNLNDYYDKSLKCARLVHLLHENFHFRKVSLENKQELAKAFENYQPKIVINLAAQAGVRYSLENPEAYIESNIVGFLNLLEQCRRTGVEHLLYASTSSVYGANTGIPFSVHHPTEHPLSLYGATKKANELLAHSYSYLHGLPTTGLRFFTVYGPWGRPDMALFLFTEAILENKPIKIFNHGKMKRDFTYVDDVASAIVHLLHRKPIPNPNWDGTAPDLASSIAPYKIYNIGNHNPVELLEFVEIIEKKLGRKAKKELLPLQRGDVEETFANIDGLIEDINFAPNTPIEEGIEKFIDWYKGYYKIE